MTDPLINEAKLFLESHPITNISALQRHMNIDYARAWRILDQLEREPIEYEVSINHTEEDKWHSKQR